MDTRSEEDLRGTTHATVERVSDRTPRPLEGKTLAFDMRREIEALEREGPYRAHGHNARTLVKHDEFRVVLVVLQQGAKVREHETYHHGAVQVLTGRLSVHVPDQQIELQTPDLLALGHVGPRSIEALENSAFLLMLGWSED